jgi:hypothetical protein
MDCTYSHPASHQQSQHAEFNIITRARPASDSLQFESKHSPTELAVQVGEAMASVKGATLVDTIVMASAASRGGAVYISNVDDLERLRQYFPSVRVFGVRRQLLLLFRVHDPLSRRSLHISSALSASAHALGRQRSKLCVA